MDKGGGVSFHRLFTPFADLQSTYPDVTVDVSQERDEWIDIDFEKYDVCVFSRWMGNYHYNLIEKLKLSNCKIWVDNDDYWVLPKWNPAYKAYKKLIKNALLDSFQFADIITTTTQKLADEIRTVTNIPIYVIPNCLDLKQSQWNIPKVKSDKLRIGWVGGSSHEEDLKVLGNSIKRFCEEYDAEFYMGGHMIEYGVWHDMEKCITGTTVDKRPDWFKTIRASSPDTYGSMYAQFDIAIAPLQESRFNSFKSELKIIEAAAYNLPIICSNVHPYKSHQYNPGCILTTNNEESWYLDLVGMKIFTQLFQMGSKNAEYCNENYNLKEFTKYRYELLCNLITNDLN